MSANKIHLTIKALMQMKSKRDGFNFTLYQLAKALNMTHSVLFRLISSQASKRVSNPRIDTLLKIVAFFKTDGFNITVNDLLMGIEDKSAINIQEQKLGSFLFDVKLALYSFNAIELEKIGTLPIKLTTNSEHIIALLSDEEIKPLFKKASIFIINTQLKPEDDHLVAVKLKNYQKILIRKFHVEGANKWLHTFDNSIEAMLWNSQLYSLIGVVIQIIAKT